MLVPVNKTMDSSDEEAVDVAAMLLLIIKKKECEKKKKLARKMWTKNWIDSRLSQGAYHALIKELRQGDEDGYRNFLRMDSTSFDILLSKVAPYITRESTRMRLSIPAEERLALTLRWLAGGKQCFGFLSN